MRKILIAGLVVALASPAFAKDSGDAAFELLSQYTAEKQRPNYIKLQSSIDMADAMAIDAKISEIYGTPEVSRDGLKVWEVENTSGKGGKKTTIMCGPDENGGIFISADRRGKATQKAAKGEEKLARRAQRKADRKAEAKAKRQMNRQERD
jgi:hypothetical protein